VNDKAVALSVVVIVVVKMRMSRAVLDVVEDKDNNEVVDGAHAMEMNEDDTNNVVVLLLNNHRVHHMEEEEEIDENKIW